MSELDLYRQASIGNTDMNLTTSKFLCSSLMALVSCAGCGFDSALLHTIASLGGSTAGERGNAQVIFINNTPNRAIFTFGTYDEFDRDTVPNLTQFSSAESTQDLEGNSQVGPLDIECARVFSVGGQGLLSRINSNLDEEDYDSTPLVSGVYFSSSSATSDDADQPTAGTAAALDAFIGVDFECGSMLIYRFETNDLGPEEFKVELTVIPAESTRGT